MLLNNDAHCIVISWMIANSSYLLMWAKYGNVLEVKLNIISKLKGKLPLVLYVVYFLCKSFGL